MKEHCRLCRGGPLLLVLLLPSGCALLTKGDPLTPRYFSAEPSEARSTDPAGAHGAPASGAAQAPELRLGRVTSASYLGERLVFRRSSTELGFYEDRRWTEKPEMYFRRALSRALFEEGGFRRTVSGGGPTLDVELVEFAELLAPAHVGRARVNFVLYDGRAVRTEGTLSVELPIRAAKEPEQAAIAVSALSQALKGAVTEIVTRVRASLSEAPQ
ncbi:MAG TPA: ABC-type transport auxiliary lipoprotein family protein [Polyangiaceae bacterium]